MSNPAVIILDSVSKTKGKLSRFQIEDNIGESIHIHIDDMRFDFSINEFLKLTKLIEDSLNSLNLFGKFNIDSFDPVFLKDNASKIPYISNISIEEIKISSLQCITRQHLIKDIFWLKTKNIKDIPAFKYLEKNDKSFVNYPQNNFFYRDNIERIDKTLDSINKNGYPYQDRYIILFNNQNIIRDGQHRVGVLAHLSGLNTKIKVMRIDFNNKFKVNNIKNNLMSLLKKIIKVNFIFLKYLIPNSFIQFIRKIIK